MVTSEDEEEAEALASHEGEPAFHVVGTVSPSSKGEKWDFLREKYEVSEVLNAKDCGTLS